MTRAATVNRKYPPLTEAQQALVIQWQYLVPWYLNRYCSSVLRGYHREALETALLAALVRAAQTYDPTKSVFSTHATWRFRGAYSAWLDTRINRHTGEPKPVEIPASEAMARNLVPIDSDPFENRAYQDRAEYDLSNAELVDLLRRHCSPRDWEILTLRHQEGWTLRAIGDRHGITKERVRQILETVGARLRAEFAEVAV